MVSFYFPHHSLQLWMFFSDLIFIGFFRALKRTIVEQVQQVEGSTLATRYWWSIPFRVYPLYFNFDKFFMLCIWGIYDDALLFSKLFSIVDVFQILIVLLNVYMFFRVFRNVVLEKVELVQGLLIQLLQLDTDHYYSIPSISIIF